MPPAAMTESKAEKSKKSFRRRLTSSFGASRNKKEERRDDADQVMVVGPASDAPDANGASRSAVVRSQDDGDVPKKKKGRGERLMRRVRSLSRSRSQSRRRQTQSSGEDDAARPETIVTVTSCRSDGYYNQKAPGSTTKLPRKAPSNLKLFHELAVGLKDAYAAVGMTPTKPITDGDEEKGMKDAEFLGRTVLWEFIGNIDFLLALVDEVAVDTATRGALKDDQTFKGLRDVIKKCNKVLEEMLVRRERRYTLFFRLPDPTETKTIDKIKAWNDKVEKAVGAVTDGQNEGTDASEATAESETDASSVGTAESSSTKGSVFSRGRQLLPVAGRVRARRATPTPSLRKHRSGSNSTTSESAAEDGFATQTRPAVSALSVPKQADPSKSLPNGLVVTPSDHQKPVIQGQPMQPKDELVDVIRGLRMEKMKNREGTPDNDITALKPDWRPKADIPSAVPKLPIEYIHRHRLMKQVVNCLLEQPGATQREGDEKLAMPLITAITSRHGDKAGNGKTILAVAAIQTVEIRERFSDGIGWIQLGRGPLTDKDVRRLYEDLYMQLVEKDDNLDFDDLSDDGGSVELESANYEDSKTRQSRTSSRNSEAKLQRLTRLAESRRIFHGGDIEGIKEDLGRLLSKKKVLIVLDDVCRSEDAKWFIFDNKLLNGIPPTAGKRVDHQYSSRILMTTRTPSLLGPSLVQEVFVRILSEHEAVKLLLSTAGRRPYGGKNSLVFNQAKLIVKGCGNSPLAVRISGSMLRQSNRSWNINSPAWSALIHQCRLNLEEASKLRSFVNAVNRVVDLSFFTVTDVRVRVALRRCFVAFATAFGDNDWMLSGKGIPQSVALRLFRTILSSEKGLKDISSSQLLLMLEKLNLLERARHGCSHAPLRLPHSPSAAGDKSDGSEKSDSDWDDDNEPKCYSGSQQMFVMHDSLKAVADEMATRTTPTLSPDADDFTSCSDKIDDEKKFIRDSKSLWGAPLRFIAQHFGSTQSKAGLREDESHRLVVSALLNIGDDLEKSGSVGEALKNGQLDVLALPGGGRMEEYLTAFLPNHLMRCHALPLAGEVLSDSHFIGRRVHAHGFVEATQRQIADLQELRRIAANISTTSPAGMKAASAAPLSPGASSNADEKEINPVGGKFDASGIVREGSKNIVEEVYRIANSRPHRSSDSLALATCLAAVGENLLRCRQPRDATLRLEEAIGIYRRLLGPNHLNVADALQYVARALVKLGETRVALLKFAEAARIYESCGATLHFNSIANAQSLASLLVDLGDLDKAQSMFEEVISMRKTVFGTNCVPVAKTINSYAIILAKHGKMNEALAHYEAAKSCYKALPESLVKDPEFDIKCKYDMTLINLNIASIRSKKGELDAAITCYEDGVKGLREYETAYLELHKESSKSSDHKNTAHKHLIAALGRIGSLKLKIGDNEGALIAYMTLLREVNDESPAASQTEKAKAHIKCATIFRQQDGENSKAQSIMHLREALTMYTSIFGPEHKDTLAIASSLRQWLSEDKSES